MRKLGIYLGLLVALFLVVELLWHTPLQQGGEAPPVTRTVAVVDITSGAPVDDAQVLRLDEAGQPVGSPLPVDRGGRVELSVASPRLLRVEAVGYHPRTLGIGPSDSLTVPLAPDSAGSVTVQLAGEVSMDAAVLPPDAPAPTAGAPPTASPQERLLASVAPILGEADLTYADLATALVADPAAVLDAGAVNTQKRSVRVSPAATADALVSAGVDVVNLANNHVNDALEGGLVSTLAALDEAGIAHAGAGLTLADAWAPAYVEAGGQTVAFLGCTTLSGAAFTVPFVATPDQGGAAGCRVGPLARAVTAAAAQADAVVVTVHGGAATGVPTSPADLAAEREEGGLTAVAARAGATVVVGGYAQTLRFVRDVAGVPFVQGTGPLVTASQTWRSRLAALVTVSVAGGEVANLIADPLALVGPRPVPAVGSVGDAASRALTGTSAGLLALGDQTAYWPKSTGQTAEQRQGEAGQVRALGVGRWPAGRPSGARVGQDLLWGTGSMEDLETDPATNGATLWDLGKYVTTSMEAGCHGVQGMRLRRGPLSERDVVISPSFRQPVLPGTQLTLTANVLLASEGASLEVRWYRTMDPTRRSAGAASVPIPPKRLGQPCEPVRLDLVVPEGMVAAQPYVRLSPRRDVNIAAELRVDDVRLIAWDSGGLPDLRADTIEHLVAGAVEVRRETTAAAG